MGLSVYLYLGLLVAVAVLRLAELKVSRRNRQSMLAKGAEPVPEPHFKWIVVVHTGVLIGAGLEVIALHRPFLPVLAATMFVLFLASNLMRFWVVRALGDLWSVQVMDSTRIGVVTTGPFRFVRHPNYTGVILEMISLPLIHTAWITAISTSLAYSLALSMRIRAEEGVLMANPEYRAA
ncbi:MAG TPA: isoprenylcysteine carboxylmethyltransferase family protein, partial [Candidatus Dormibacteraeota bacterium]|nr:isoprenylcysteine carboxylmethyltransferase family protein [Candidatus Dormibacteraeota bacterium]